MVEGSTIFLPMMNMQLPNAASACITFLSGANEQRHLSPQLLGRRRLKAAVRRLAPAAAAAAIGKRRMKPHFTWPVWPSGNVKETHFLFCWKTSPKWVTGAKKWTQCEIRPRESRFFRFFSAGTEREEQLTQWLESQRSHISNPTLPPTRRFLHCS